MFQESFYIVFPEGDVQEIPGRIQINALVDMNGRPLDLPLPSSRIIAFRVRSIRTVENRGSSETFHHLELAGAEELSGYVTGSRTFV